ncbi:MAG: BolA/IbaG family iron-sulfur metabolism protein [Gammaproteobacteria bacterium]|nr:BolA/IbaG family iron-sulfur metabolism protein [Gammaproteobacteria bacterium]MYD76709.1 BolA/IbaG family iron-sulfur metabolism protein [Gammaproteobacteria bacterium]MYJ51613.1 BolA/IbaG family iron-sulfur metabolism protein [Gammaproteobacteria bacterium]
MVTPQDIEKWIASGLRDSEVAVTGDGRHFEARIVYAGFAGKSLVQRHQMVYQVLGDKMREDIHALSMKTFTRDEL